MLKKNANSPIFFDLMAVASFLSTGILIFFIVSKDITNIITNIAIGIVSFFWIVVILLYSIKYRKNINNLHSSSNKETKLGKKNKDDEEFFLN
ncbi:MAG: hypothetical protein WC533_04695 [Candidatus Pacearchaeota archaeon]